MDWQAKMNRAVGYIEENLTGEIDLKAAARYTGCSLWEFQRLFSFVTHTSLGEYIRNRRLSLAGDELQNSGEKIIDIAIKYGYDSPAAFSRAFGRQYGVSPSQARGGGVTLPAYPKITFQTIDEERTDSMNGKNDLQTYSERGYYVKENAPVYFTRDMEKTCAWFCDTLGWYGDIAGRDESGTPIYGCTLRFFEAT
ncbi:MAG: helix-turn-helix domain-containing protein [Oscillospiraceae bacterium]|jgi:AraC family transcriptional regulator|nr:helix-turn-helix domain-containing protein [Oscillospiraceae bacterium]